MSFLDVLLLTESDTFNSSREFFDFVMWDVLSYVSTTFFYSQSLYYTNYQDFFIVILYHSPELSLAVVDFINFYWFNASTSYAPSAVFDIFSDAINSTVDELLKYLFMFITFIWVFVFVTGDSRIQEVFKLLNPTMVRLESFFFC